MFAPQIKNLASFGRSYEGESALDAPSRKKLDEFFETLDRFEHVGNDNLHVLWLRARRDFAFFEPLFDVVERLYGAALREQFESCWREEFTREGASLLPHIHWLPMDFLRLKSPNP